jgi:radical SAM-linked protein
MTDLSQRRFRIWFRKGEPVKYISHLDLLRAWERILRRAGLPLAYSQGFNPHPRIVIAMPLAVGCTGSNEAVDVILDRAFDAARMETALQVDLPEGIAVHAVESVEWGAPAMPSVIEYAIYWIRCRDISCQEVQRRGDAFISQEQVIVHFRRKTFDLRPLVGSLVAREDKKGVLLEAKLLRNERGRIGRPDVLLDAMDLSDHMRSIDRKRIAFDLDA